jgi:phenylacetate-coenzyme A ligase PaaK-like adenylate-forming protein
MPFIRYRIGDIASRCDDRTPCPSGTGWLSFSGLLGRLSRVIQFRGRYINPITYFGDSLAGC